MDYFVIAMQLILSLSILIVLHELGHFIPAKLFKTRVEKFYLFFNPWFSIFKVKKGETEYGIGWLPLGGYVKISGMVDETETLSKKEKGEEEENDQEDEPQPWEFRSKPAWQRLIIMIGGIFVNMVLGIFIYAMVLWGWGEKYIPAENAKFGVSIALDELKAPGLFQEGDKILKIGNTKLETVNEATRLILIDGEKEVEVNRNGEIVKFKLPDDIEQTLLKKKVSGGLFTERFPGVISEVAKNTEAQKVGLAEGDSLVFINGKTFAFYYDLKKEIESNKGKEIELGLYRDGSLMNKKIKVSDKGTIGFFPKSPDKFFNVAIKKYGFFESFPAGWNQAIGTLTSYVKSMRLLFTKEGAKQVGGFGSMAKLFPSTWDWQRFWLNTALISIILAFMNFLPIPALDGGYILFLFFEMITGIKPTDKFMEKANTVGFIIILLLLVYANGNDIFGFFK